MDIHQLKTFVAVAREGSVTRASERVHLSQPAVSAHVKALEDTLGLSLFERTPKGMTLTPDGQRLLARAEQTIAAHQALMDEATRLKGKLSGKLRLGAGSSSSHEAVGRLVTRLAERHPEVEVVLKHGTSQETLAGLRSGALDAGFYNDAGEPAEDLTAHPSSQFSVFVAAAPGRVPRSDPPSWSALAGLPWVYPPTSACCSRTAERLFKAHHFQPARVIGVDRPELICTLVASGVGVGLLHADVAEKARAAGEVELLFECDPRVSVLFAHLKRRAEDPLLAAAASLLEAR